MTVAAGTAATKATERAAGAQRALVGLLGLLGLAAGAVALVVSFGLLGADRADRPVLDPLAVDVVGSHQSLARVVAILAGVVLLILGLLWVARALHPGQRPNLVLDSSPEHHFEVSVSAIADALRADAEAIDGVSRARVRLAGTTATPVVALTLWLANAASISVVCHDLDTWVLTCARDSLGVESLTTAVRVELDSTTPSRVN